MRAALEQRSGEAQLLAVAIPERIPAPIKGWNLIDPVAKMEPEYAFLLDNWIPRPGYCEPRKGQSSWSTGFGAHAVNSFIPYVGAGTRKLFAASNLGFFDVGAGGAIGAAVYAITESKAWISQQFATLATTYVSAVNGVDAAAKFDGANWTAQAITVADPTKLNYVTAYQGRLWFTQKNTLTAWYLAAGAIEGAATAFNLQTQARLGGKLLGVQTWSPDAGTGLGDYLVFVTDQGEVIVYQGVNPDVPSSFALVGTFRVPKSFGTDPFLRFGPDLLLLTQQGVYPVSKGLQAATIDKTSSITYLISPQFAIDFALYGALYGWSMCLYTEDNLLIVNAPQNATGLSNQYVMNTLTGAWCRFTGVSAIAWVVFEKVLYFAGQSNKGANIVGKALFDTTDFGADIVTAMITAYNYFEGAAVNKQVKLIRPNIITDASLSLGLAVSTDFAPLIGFQRTDFSALLSSPAGAAIWGTGVWDQSLWGFAPFTPLQWRSIYANPGYALAVGLQTRTQNATIRLASFDLLLEPGGPL